jgi:hypothetical protein
MLGIEDIRRQARKCLYRKKSTEMSLPKKKALKCMWHGLSNVSQQDNFLSSYGEV